MPDELRERLIESGWNREEIEKTENMLAPRTEKERQHIIEGAKKTSAMMFWMMLIAMVFGNFLVSLVLIPVIMALRPGQVDVVVLVLGLMVGLLFNHLIWSMEGVDEKHHYFAMLFIPCIALLNMSIVVVIANYLAAALNIPKTEDPIVKSLFYMVGFVAPYAATLAKNEFRKRKSASSLSSSEAPKKKSEEYYQFFEQALGLRKAEQQEGQQGQQGEEQAAESESQGAAGETIPESLKKYGF